MATPLLEAVTSKVDFESASAFSEMAMEKALSFSFNLVFAICLLIGGVYMARLAAEAVRQRMLKAKRFDRTLIPFLTQGVRYVVMAVTFVLVLSNFGIETTSIIAVLGAAGLAIGLALQGTLQNVAAGIMLLIIRPFGRGDYIEAGDAAGTVDAIGFFVTRMTTVHGLFVSVPNRILWANKITNYTRFPNRRLDLPIGISYDDDIDDALSVVMGLLKADSRVMDDPEPLVFVRGLGDSSVDLELRAWTKRQDYWALHFDMMREIKLALDGAGISIPYPHRQVVLPDGVFTGGDSEGGTPPKKKPTKTAAKPANHKKQRGQSYGDDGGDAPPKKKRTGGRRKPGNVAV